MDVSIVGRLDDKPMQAAQGVDKSLPFFSLNAKQEDYFEGQKNIKQGMGIAMLAFIAAAGLS